MSDKKYTQTSTFLFPLLEIPKQLFRCDVTNNFNKKSMVYIITFISKFISR